MPSFLTIFIVWCIFAFGSFGGLMVLGFASKIIDAAGGSMLIGSIALAGVALGNTGGRLSVAGLCTILPPIAVPFVSVVILLTGLLLSGASANISVLTIGLTLVALGYGIMASAVPTLVGDVFSQDRFSRLFPIIFTAWGAAGLAAPWSAGVILDQTGSFLGAIYLAAAASLMSGVATLILRARI